jgi:inosine/xanthosine triphosphate pyrophosphatase family protein
MSPQRTASRPPILLATTNPAKERAFRWLLEGLPLSPVTPGQMGLDSVPEEEGDTHEAIARGKAAAWSAAGGSMLAIASDGGLVIPTLGSRWESRYTHRFAGPAADDRERVRRLLELMRPYRGAARQASWVEALVIADRGQVLASWELRGGTGVISETPADEPLIPGFWAFSVWFFPQLGKSYNQLSPQEREALDDHWTRLRPMVQRFLRDHLAQPPDG